MRTSDFWSRAGGAPVHRVVKLRDEQLTRHANGIVSIGLCPIQRGESTVQVALLDMDSHKGEVPWSDMIRHAARLAAVASLLYGIEFTPFRSTGGSGIHLLAMWNEPQDAWSVRCALRDILDAEGFKDGFGGVAKRQIEVFPKQNHVPADGWGSMFILPGSGRSEPLDAELLISIDWHEIQYRMSASVPFAEPPAAFEAGEIEHGDTDLDRIRSALAAIDPNELGYGGIAGAIGWLEILFAVHAATQGSPAGRALIVEWSQRWSGWDPIASVGETDKQWRYAQAKPGGIGPGTLFARARQGGWVDPDAAAKALDPDGFDALLPAAQTEPGDGPAIMVPGDGDGRLTGMARAMLDPGSVGCSLYYDSFLDEIIVQWGRGAPRRLDRNDTTRFRLQMEQLGYQTPTVDDTRAMVAWTAFKRERDGAIEWLDSLPTWDGKRRIDTYAVRYLGAADTPYTRAVGAYLWTAAAGRVLKPGCKADMVPVLVGPQGIRKSTAVEAMVPDPELFSTVRLDAPDEVNARLLKGKLVAEIAELQGIRGREVESVKAWITKSYEEWIPKYVEAPTKYYRRCLFIGTTNDRAFLSDPTGNRRWLPLLLKGTIDTAAIERDRLQLWAEARVRYEAEGIAYADAERLARDILEDFVDHDEWEIPIEQHLRQHGAKTIREIAVEVLGQDLRGLTPQISRRIGRCLRAIGAEDKSARRGATVTRVWFIEDSRDPFDLL